MRKVGHKDEEWKKVLDYFEKEINQSLDYLNAKRQSDVIDINYNYLKDKSKEGD